MSFIPIKPLTVNQCWQGKRFKTSTYRRYEKDLMMLLPTLNKRAGKLRLDIKFGMSSKLSDIDNPLKPFIDVLQKKYGFNDRDIHKLVVEKELVKKGEEFIMFFIEPIDQQAINIVERG